MREYLKSGTAQLHIEIEAEFDLLGQVTSLQDYRTTLRRIAALHATVGAAIAAVDWPDPVDLGRLEQRRAWLAQDLATLGCGDFPPAAAFALDGRGEALGCLYVLEGSMLGGLVIARRVRDTLGIDVDNGGRFFHGFGKRTAAEWSAFLTALARHPVATEGPEALSGARKTFALFAGLRDAPPQLTPPPA